MSQDNARFITDPHHARQIRALTELGQLEERQEQLKRQIMVGWQGFNATAVAVVAWRDDAWSTSRCSFNGWREQTDPSPGSFLRVGLSAAQLSSDGEGYDSFALIDLDDESLMYHIKPEMVREVKSLPQIPITDAQRDRLELVGIASIAARLGVR